MVVDRLVDGRIKETRIIMDALGLNACSLVRFLRRLARDSGVGGSGIYGLASNGREAL